jgi:hypothetical protein
MFWRRMRAPHGHLYCMVSHQFGYRSQIRSLHHKPAGECMPQVVPGEVTYFRLADGIFKPMARTTQGLTAIATGKDWVPPSSAPVKPLECSQRRRIPV